MSFNFTDDPLEAFEAEYSKASNVYSDLLTNLKKSPLEATFSFGANKVDVTAMSLATVSKSGQPSNRTVLLKGLIRGGFAFYTNYDSQKGEELAENPRCALLFHWPFLEEQIRIEGQVEKLTRAESEAYFKTRPRDSQIGAWASHQSQEIPSQAWLSQRFKEFDQKFSRDVPCPPHWGGYRVEPHRMEFWFGQPGRLHERYVYQKQDTIWKKLRKSP